MPYTIFNTDTGHIISCDATYLLYVRWPNYQVWRGRRLIYQVGW
jgi:hypothetical protein